jgi:hypothetical protein
MGAYTGTPTRVGPGGWEVSDRQGKLICIRKRLSLTLSAQGGATNTISATSLGFRSTGLISAKCILFTDGSAQKRHVNLFTDGTYLYVADPTNPTDATRGIPGDVTGTLVCEVDGLV